MQSSRLQTGFSLIELMVAVAIIGILAAIAIPMYRDYVLKSTASSLTQGLQDAAVRMERYFQDNHRYNDVADSTSCGVANFTDANNNPLTCTALSNGQGYTFSASAKGFIFTINQSGGHGTDAIPSAWGTAPAAAALGGADPHWITHKES